MFNKKIVFLLIIPVISILLSSCISNNPPSNVQVSILCGSNILSITYTAGGSLETELSPSYFAIVMRGNISALPGDIPGVEDMMLGLAGAIPIDILPDDELPPGFAIPAMPSEPAGQRYTIHIPIMGPNMEFTNDPWPDGTSYTVMFFYDMLADEEGNPGIAYYENITCGTQPTSPSPQWWDPGDGRINRDPGALGVIYPISYGARGMGLHIYRIGTTNGQGTLWLEITPEMLANVPAIPSEYTIVARSADGYIELAKLPTGQYQVNTGPDAEGKIHVVVFNEIRTGSPWFFFTVSIYGVPQ